MTYIMLYNVEWDLFKSRCIFSFNCFSAWKKVNEKKTGKGLLSNKNSVWYIKFSINNCFNSKKQTREDVGESREHKSRGWGRDAKRRRKETNMLMWSWGSMPHSPPYSLTTLQSFLIMRCSWTTNRHKRTFHDNCIVLKKVRVLSWNIPKPRVKKRTIIWITKVLRIEVLTAK